MRFDVSQNLRQPVGSSNTYDIAERVTSLANRTFDGDIAGQVNFLRTDKGLLVSANLKLTMQQNCSRCLRPIKSVAELTFEEEYLPTVDVVTGERLPLPEDAENFLIDARQTLDLTEAIRQYSEMVRPIQPLCRPDCLGFCPTCGADLNNGPCDCPTNEIDDRWAPLTSLSARLKQGEGS